MLGIYLLCFASFLSIANTINKSHKNFNVNYKYIFTLAFTSFMAIPIFFVLWDFYSIAKLCYCFFGEISFFSFLLLVKYILRNLLCDFLDDKYHNLLQTNNAIYVIIAIFCIVLYLGHLDIVSFDIMSDSKKVAIFAGIFAIVLYLVDRMFGLLALNAITLAVILKENIMFALFDGYLLIFSVFYTFIFICSNFYKRFR